MNNDEVALNEQRRVIDQIMRSNINNPINNALDCGGDRGETFGEEFKTAKNMCTIYQALIL